MRRRGVNSHLSDNEFDSPAVEVKFPTFPCKSVYEGAVPCHSIALCHDFTVAGFCNNAGRPTAGYDRDPIGQ